MKPREDYLLGIGSWIGERLDSYPFIPIPSPSEVDSAAIPEISPHGIPTQQQTTQPADKNARIEKKKTTEKAPSFPKTKSLRHSPLPRRQRLLDTRATIELHQVPEERARGQAISLLAVKGTEFSWNDSQLENWKASNGSQWSKRRLNGKESSTGRTSGSKKSCKHFGRTRGRPQGPYRDVRV
ncbi:hypothetical protein B0H67DRAFT_219408 [Lasiosphaeris hirsuta]|uniref:Uncharacterized protein n=1 Tax=Lasiosphaeris hirsuta TaxID=260670 RepID=A0AA40AF54_9PEZI|nr:hypothetical protein B0H67DRAFT_219408 [Lasiosphaeris hirsuta]